MTTLVRAAVAALLLATGASAVWGGSMLLTSGWEMDPALLARTPFDDWTVPGLATVALPGVGVLVAGLAVALRLPHHRTLALAAGAGLVLWVVVQLAWLQTFHPLMHPLIAGIGLAVVGLARALPRPAQPRSSARRSATVSRRTITRARPSATDTTGGRGTRL